MLSAAEGPVRKLSLPTRGGWIEIPLSRLVGTILCVPPPLQEVQSKIK